MGSSLGRQNGVVCRACKEEVRARWARFCVGQTVRTFTWRHSLAASDKGGFMEGRGRGPEAKFKLL